VIFEVGTLEVHNEKAQINIQDESTKRWRKIDLTKEKPTLYHAKLENREYVKGEVISWSLRGSDFVSLIEEELNNIEELAKYAILYNCELQVIHS
jgi:hypothetical protein